MLLARTPLSRVRGLVAGEPVEARWVPGHGLMCPRSLRERSEILVGMNEMFSGTEGGPTVAASLDRPLAAMLTATRAMSRVLSVEMSVEDDRAACWGRPACGRSSGPATRYQLHCRARLAGYKCPTVVEIVDSLPRNMAGKVRKRELRAARTDRAF